MGAGLATAEVAIQRPRASWAEPRAQHSSDQGLRERAVASASSTAPTGRVRAARQWRLLVALQQLVESDGQIPHADTGSVVHGVGNGGRRPYTTELADPLGPVGLVCSSSPSKKYASMERTSALAAIAAELFRGGVSAPAMSVRAPSAVVSAGGPCGRWPS
jgi:hypothetical protein